MEKVGRPAADRASALESYPQMQSAPVVLIFRLVRLLGESGDFDQAEELLQNRFFLREEGGANIRDVYVRLKLQRARSAVAKGQCALALETVQHLADPVPTLPFTAKGMAPFATSDSARQSIEEIRSACH